MILDGKEPSLPGFRTVGVGKQHDKPVLVIFVDPEDFKGGVPAAFEGYDVLVQAFVISVAHAAEILILCGKLNP